MKAYLLDAAVARYVSDHTTAPDALLAALERETAEVAGEDATMQISFDQGRLLTMITQLMAPGWPWRWERSPDIRPSASLAGCPAARCTAST